MLRERREYTNEVTRPLFGQFFCPFLCGETIPDGEARVLFPNPDVICIDFVIPEGANRFLLFLVCGFRRWPLFSVVSIQIVGMMNSFVLPMRHTFVVDCEKVEEFAIHCAQCEGTYVDQ